jgi:glycogen phosphorylase
MSVEPRIAYFSMEIAIEAAIPTYSGGLGVLSGDTLRAAADIGLPVVGVSLLHRQGFFRQRLGDDGSQSEVPASWQPERHLELIRDCKVEIGIEGRRVCIQPWIYRVRGASGDTVAVFFLDADLPENDPQDRALTGMLYGGDQRYRLCQEALLGIGGTAMLRALGYRQLETFHMNEGHSALLTLSLLEEACGRNGLESAGEDEYSIVRARSAFTTHTPVAAGHDRFGSDLWHSILDPHLIAAIERLPFIHDGVLNMTELGLFFSRYVNGVARRHGEVASAMHPGFEVNSITNGIHAGTWASPSHAALFDREIPGWRKDNHNLRQANMLHLDHIMDAHSHAKHELLDEVAKRSGVRLDPSVLTIGFARRAATYKRADLVFNDVEKLRELSREGGPIQFIFAGKAHPADEPGKELIRRVFSARDHLRSEVPVVWLEDYDMTLGRVLCAGVDVWLNNPVKPMEASGTSGMKAALNGVPSLSVLDGWWPEGWIEGVTGWSIGTSPESDSDTENEVSSLYNKLRYVILPLYYGSPSGWARVMRSTIAINGSYFTAQRMVQQYALSAYQPGPDGAS